MRSIPVGGSGLLTFPSYRAPFSTPSKRLADRSAAHTRYSLPDRPAITRFAPSPTGNLHLGSLRTALFNYLLAKSTGGRFILRIEDTDQKRVIDGAERKICEDLKWAGLQWDEGPEVGGPCGPYHQSERTSSYQEHAKNLLDCGHAYHCFCSKDRLAALAKGQQDTGTLTGYDRVCEGISQEDAESRVAAGHPFIIRFRAPDVYPLFNDLVYGKVGKQLRPGRRSVNGVTVYEDAVLLKEDGYPTYHLANVVDDHDMKVTHVIRATEWLSSTPMHLALYDAFQWEAPRFAHVGLLQDGENQKLSKRNAAQGIRAMAEGLELFPETLTNFVALLGWSHKRGSDIMNLQELIENFDLKFTKGNSVVAYEKLTFLQRAHARRRIEEGGPDFDEIVVRVCAVAKRQYHGRERPHADEQSLTQLYSREKLAPFVAAILRIDASNYISATDFVKRNHYFFVHENYSMLRYRPPYPPEQSINFVESFRTLAHRLRILGEKHVENDGKIERWTSEKIKDVLSGMHTVATQNGQKPGREVDGALWNKAMYYFLRWAITHGEKGPPIADVMRVLGCTQTIKRLHHAIDALEDNTKAMLDDTSSTSTQ